MTHSLKPAALSAVMFLISTFAIFAWEVPDETLHYSVRFKWGVIDANVGIATVTTHNIPGSDSFEATLSGKSINLLGHYYAASDNITGTILLQPQQPSNNAALTSRHGEFSIETITRNANGPSNNGPVTAHLPDGKVIRTRESSYASGLSTDLLSVFYYMRQIDYTTATPGATFNINLNVGNHLDNLQITYTGPEQATFAGEEKPSRHITLSFTVGGKSDRMDVWIADDEARTPLFIQGTLSVGRMECTLVDQQTIDSLQMAGQ